MCSSNTGFFLTYLINKLIVCPRSLSNLILCNIVTAICYHRNYINKTCLKNYEQIFKWAQSWRREPKQNKNQNNTATSAVTIILYIHGRNRWKQLLNSEKVFIKKLSYFILTTPCINCSYNRLPRNLLNLFCYDCGFLWCRLLYGDLISWMNNYLS